ncbi:MAG: two-component system response regulator OmpR [Rugosibacter sp.]|nr:two-component system response regulator OmpR [Rugosibacter sp.]
MNEESTQNSKILVVDDDLRLRQLLDRYLSDQGFSVKVVPDSAGMNRAMERERFDLIVLDLMLPGEDGLAICRRLRSEKNDVSIIMLTDKGDEVERIVGLEMGADDYLPKPFNPRELVARIHAVLRRRSAMTAPGAPATTETTIQFGKVQVNLATRELHRNTQESKDTEITLLTTGEFGLLRALLEHPRQPMSRDKLMELARGREYEVFDRAIDVQISRLRKLVEEDPTKPRYIQTVWGLGYVFIPDGTKQN